MTLHRSNFAHIYSEVILIDRSSDSKAKVCGITEWSFELGRKALSLAWDWRRVNDGAIVFDDMHGIRTNMMLICEKGYDFGTSATEAQLADRIANMPWQTEVAMALRSFKVTRRACLAEKAGMNRPLHL